LSHDKGGNVTGRLEGKIAVATAAGQGIGRAIAEAFLPGMLARAEANGSSGSIVNIPSGASSVRGVLNRYAYGASTVMLVDGGFAL
jgi:hypothetical protein